MDRAFFVTELDKATDQLRLAGQGLDALSPPPAEPAAGVIGVKDHLCLAGQGLEALRQALGAEGPAPERRDCPHCHKRIMAAALRCLHC